MTLGKNGTVQAYVNIVRERNVWVIFCTREGHLQKLREIFKNREFDLLY